MTKKTQQRKSCKECKEYLNLSRFSDEELQKEESTCNLCIAYPEMNLKEPVMMEAKCLRCDVIYPAIFPFGICPCCKDSEEYKIMDALTVYSVGF